MNQLIFDAHLDLAMNAIEWNRDLTRPLSEIRAREQHLRDKPDRGRGTVCLPELRRGRVAFCVATVLARLTHDQYSPVFGWNSPAQAWAMVQAQLAWYEAMEEAGEVTILRDLAAMQRHQQRWEQAAMDQKLPLGLILSMEGADSLVTVEHLTRLHARGLRAIGPAHYGPGVYAMGTDAPGKLPERGLELLKAIGELGLILDATHLSDESFWQTLELYNGPVWASHHLARALVPHQRQLSDEMFLALVARGAVVGLAFDAWMIVPGWKRGETTPASANCRLETLAEHLDHYCQLAGNAQQVGIGSDLDGAFGTEQVPQGFTSIADLQKFADLLRQRGYPESDVEGIMFGNFRQFLERAWR
jgi:membrane dipeptidase